MSVAANRKVLLFAPAAHNLAEVTRAIEVARACRNDFEPVFLSYDGTRRNRRFIEQEGFAIRDLEPQLTEEMIERWWRLDRGEAFGGMFETGVLSARVDAEQALYEELKPAAVITGFCLSVPLSARLAGLPLVWMIQTTWLSEYSYQRGTWPDAADYAVLRAVLPERIRDWLGRRLTPVTYWILNREFSREARRRGLPPFRGSDLFEGDYNLFAEPPTFSGIEVPARLAGRYHFIGPLIAHLPLEVPDAVRQLPRDRPIVYFAMGSSGAEEVVGEIMQSFAGRPYRVIAPVAPLLRRLRVSAPENVVLTDWLPAHLVNPMADISVIHGGVGTVMTACLSGTPIVGIPNGNPEQEANIECIVRKGFARRLHKRRLTARAVVAAIDEMLADGEARRRAAAFQQELLGWDGPANAATFFRATFA